MELAMSIGLPTHVGNIDYFRTAKETKCYTIYDLKKRLREFGRLLKANDNQTYYELPKLSKNQFLAGLGLPKSKTMDTDP